MRIPCMFLLLCILTLAGCTPRPETAEAYWIVISPETAVRMPNVDESIEDAVSATILLFLRSGAPEITGIIVNVEGDAAGADAYRQRLAALGIEKQHVVMVGEPDGSALMKRLAILSPNGSSSGSGMAAVLRRSMEAIFSTPEHMLGSAVLRNVGEIVDGEVEKQSVEQFFSDPARLRTAILWMQPVVIDITDDTRYLYEQEYIYQIYQAYTRETAEQGRVNGN